MNGDIGFIIFYILFGFFALILISGGITIFVLWRRRKLTFTKFLNDTGMWEGKSWMPDTFYKQFVYDNETYKFDIKKCTRDRINRPIAHYYKGNPEQQLFDYSKGNKSVEIGTHNITAKDFTVLMLSKVLRDIFQDEEVMQLLYIIIIEVGVLAVIIGILVVTHNPKVDCLAYTNTTRDFLINSIRTAIGK